MKYAIKISVKERTRINLFYNGRDCESEKARREEKNRKNKSINFNAVESE